MPTIDVKEAVKIARNYLNTVYENAPSDVRLEEVEFVREGGPHAWHVTLSFTTPSTDLPIGQSALARMLDPAAAGQLPRYYKLFVIDAQTGDVYAMKIRKL